MVLGFSADGAGRAIQIAALAEVAVGGTDQSWFRCAGRLPRYTSCTWSRGPPTPCILFLGWGLYIVRDLDSLGMPSQGPTEVNKALTLHTKYKLDGNCTS